MFKFRLDGDKWFFKAITPKKKRTFAEQPQLDSILTIEKENKKVFDKCLANAAKDIVRYLV